MTFNATFILFLALLSCTAVLAWVAARYGREKVKKELETASKKAVEDILADSNRLDKIIQDMTDEELDKEI